jgi:glycine dehydrogenase subunit 1
VRWPAGFFKEFVVDFSDTGKTVAQINESLRSKAIFGGKDLSTDFDLGQVALYCVTEIHTADDIDRLVVAITEAVGT